MCLKQALILTFAASAQLDRVADLEVNAFSSNRQFIPGGQSDLLLDSDRRVNPNEPRRPIHNVANQRKSLNRKSSWKGEPLNKDPRIFQSKLVGSSLEEKEYLAELTFPSIKAVDSEEHEDDFFDNFLSLYSEIDQSESLTKRNVEEDENDIWAPRLQDEIKSGYTEQQYLDAFEVDEELNADYKGIGQVEYDEEMIVQAVLSRLRGALK